MNNGERTHQSRLLFKILNCACADICRCVRSVLFFALESLNANEMNNRERTHQSILLFKILNCACADICRCVRSLLFFALAFNDSFWHTKTTYTNSLY